MAGKSKKSKQPTGDSNTNCTVCNHGVHPPVNCRQRAGCGRCRIHTKHWARLCPNNYDYQHFSTQLCDRCLEEDHEYRHCKLRNAKTDPPECPYCGHDHLKHQCKLTANGEKMPKKTDHNILNQFTKLYHSLHLRRLNGDTDITLKDLESLTLDEPSDSRGKRSALCSGNCGEGHQSTEDLEHLYFETGKKMPRRPKKDVIFHTPHPISQQGGGTEAYANFFEMKLDWTVKMYRYEIELGKIGERVPTNRDTKRRLIKRILTQSSSKPSHTAWATDYETVIVSVGELFKNSLNPDVNIIRTTTGVGKSGCEPFDCFFTFKGAVSLNDLKTHIQDGIDFRDLQTTIRALNLITWKGLRDGEGIKGALFGNRFFPKRLILENEEQQNIQAKHLYLVRHGFFSSIRPGSESVLLNVKPVISAFFAPIALRDWIYLRWPNTDLSRIDKEDFKRTLRGVRVWFNCDPEKKGRPIWGWGKTMQYQMFPKKVAEKVDETASSSKQRGKQKASSAHISSDKEEKIEMISVHDYMTNTYPFFEQKPVSFDPTTPCINLGNDEHPSWYPLDKLTISDWQIVRSALKEEKYARVLREASKMPQGSKDTLLADAAEFLGLQIPSRGAMFTEYYRQFGITPSPTLLKISPTKLAAPKVMLKSLQNENSIKDLGNSGSWNIWGERFVSPARNYQQLLIISFNVKDRDGKSKIDALKKEIELLKNSLKDYGVFASNSDLKHFREDVEPPDAITHAGHRRQCSARLDAALKNLKTKAKLSSFKESPILVILPNRSTSLYADVKFWADCKVGVATVCVTNKRLAYDPKVPQEDLLANIALKFNFKLHGVGHGIIPASGKTIPQSTMVVGADVTHPGDYAPGCPSIAGIVATDCDGTYHYFGSARLQTSKREYIEDLRGMMKERFEAWATKNNGQLPKKVLFYRDGVSESQHSKVLYHELPQVLDGYKDACRQLKISQDVDKLKVTLIVVTKRQHARFYPGWTCKKPNTKKIDTNLSPGQLFDEKVVAPNRFDFYLQSHASPLGTAKNAHYIVLSDNVPYDPQTLYELTNDLCYISARATKALSVCAPARYADALCDRLRCYMRLALEGALTVDDPNGAKNNQGKPLPASPECWAPNSELWGTNSANGRRNPWHEDLDQMMFYL